MARTIFVALKIYSSFRFVSLYFLFGNHHRGEECLRKAFTNVNISDNAVVHQELILRNGVVRISWLAVFVALQVYSSFRKVSRHRRTACGSRIEVVVY